MVEQRYKKLAVGLENRTYPIFIGRGLDSLLQETIRECHSQGKRVIALLDGGLSKSRSELTVDLLQSIPHLTLPGGEKTKSVEYLSGVWDFLAGAGVDRTGNLIAFGGGVTGDLAGFAAASYLRGIDFYQVPTTLLAMVDSSVGGKTGINLSAGKNLVGAFHQPKAVFIDLDYLMTLPEREFSAGMAEVIKYGLLGNQGLYQELLSMKSLLNAQSEELPGVIEACCMDKARIVELDEKETIESTGGRALLNLGHTFAHAIEAVAGYGEYLHGEAVSIGLLCSLRLSVLMGYCKESDLGELENLLNSYSLPVKLRSSLSVSDLKVAMQSDKKVSGGKLRLVAMRSIGDAFVTSGVEWDDVVEVWQSVGAD